MVPFLIRCTNAALIMRNAGLYTTVGAASTEFPAEIHILDNTYHSGFRLKAGMTVSESYRV